MIEDSIYNIIGRYILYYNSYGILVNIVFIDQNVLFIRKCGYIDSYVYLNVSHTRGY